MSKSIHQHYQEIKLILGNINQESLTRLEQVLTDNVLDLLAMRDNLEDTENRFVAFSRYLREQREKLVSLPVLHDRTA